MKFTMADTCLSYIAGLFHDEAWVATRFLSRRSPVKAEVVLVNGIWQGIYIGICWPDREGHLILACIPSFRSQNRIISM